MIDAIHAVADQASGFVWRLEADYDSHSDRPAFDPHLLVTLSVWESLESLHQFVYRSDHGRALSRRAEWFEPTEEPNLVLWWIRAGTRPTVEQAMARLRYLRRHGPTVWAFTFGKRFEPPHQGRGIHPEDGGVWEWERKATPG